MTTRQPLRLWPGVLIVVLQWLARYGLPVVLPEATAFAVLGGLLGALGVVVWWVFFSRAPRLERWGALLVMIVALIVTRQLAHESIATSGMGILFFFNATPLLCLAFVSWATATRHLSDGPRRLSMVATILLACLAWTLVRTGGITGGADSDYAWRWSKTPEERLLAQAGDEPIAPAPAPAVVGMEADWPGFRGPSRNSTIPGVRIDTDWTTSPPVELWRRQIGPGWSSFAVHGDRLYTQEQRGDDEVVSCYNATTGEPVWKHTDATRFWESNAGAGPRGTPTLHDGRVYTLGATGVLNVLEADDGSSVWSRDAASDTGAQTPTWGFSSSPLIVDGLVIVALSGQLAAYDLTSGVPRWFGPDGGGSYSSPQRFSFDEVEQILLMSATGATSVSPADGTLLWQYSDVSGSSIVQPALATDGDLLISDGQSTGMQRIAIVHSADAWSVEQRWHSNRLKPYFNDFVVHEGHAFGFDGSILACIDIADGKRMWKGGRYGHGQFLLLPDQDLLLVLSEQGELALVSATPERFHELALFPAIEGKTWNHPVLAGETLLVRNDREMAAFRLR